MSLVFALNEKVRKVQQQQRDNVVRQPDTVRVDHNRAHADPYNRSFTGTRPPPLYVGGFWNKGVYGEPPRTAPPIQGQGMDDQGRNIKELQAGVWYSNQQNRMMYDNHLNRMAEQKREYDRKSMLSDNPLPNKVAALERMNPMAQQRLYASDQGREFSKMAVHGFTQEHTLIKPTLISKSQMDEDQLKGGLKGQVDDHYNEAMFDKERDL